MKRLFWISLCLAQASCQVIGGFEPFEGSSGKVSSGGTGGANQGGNAGNAGSAGSAGEGGAGSGCKYDGFADERITIPVQWEEEKCLGIDQYEVSWKDYNRFLSESKGVDYPHNCEQKKSPNPKESKNGKECLKEWLKIDDDNALNAYAMPKDIPVTCIDWCDAMAYCNWAGKILCPGEYGNNNTEKSAWYTACSNNSDTKYCYGDDYSSGTCKDANTGDCSNATDPAECLSNVGSFKSCKTDNKIFDMSGNAAEWTNECNNTTKDAECNTRGRSTSATAESGTLCSANIPFSIASVAKTLGFRCCSTKDVSSGTNSKN